MRYHNITKDDMLNGSGLRVVLWLSGCNHKCPGCQNPITWNPDEGLLFDYKAKKEIFEQLNENYISGLTLTGGDPLHEKNIHEVYDLICEVKEKYPTKNIWIYSGYMYSYLVKSEQNYEELMKDLLDEENKRKFCEYYSENNYRCLVESTKEDNEIRKKIVELCDVFCDGPFVLVKRDTKLHWVGSSNQCVLDMNKMKQIEAMLKEKEKETKEFFVVSGQLLMDLKDQLNDKEKIAI